VAEEKPPSTPRTRATAPKAPAAKAPAPKAPAAKAPAAQTKPAETVVPAVPVDTEAAPSFSESLSAVVKQSGLTQLKPGETPSVRALFGAVGGPLGIVESVVPGIAFLVIYLTSHNLLVSVLVPAVVALVFVVARAGRKSSMSSAVTGAVLLAITAALTLITGKAVNNFVPGILINAAGFVVMLVSILVRWPLIGIIVGLLFGDADGWRAIPAKRRILTIATWLWVLLFTIRLVLEVPLYLANNVAALGVVRLITSVPLYAVFLWATWLLVRGVYAGDSAESDGESGSDTA
jgi:Protein of unknown function (DUF3159)